MSNNGTPEEYDHHGRPDALTGPDLRERVRAQRAAVRGATTVTALVASSSSSHRLRISKSQAQGLISEGAEFFTLCRVRNADGTYSVAIYPNGMVDGAEVGVVDDLVLEAPQTGPWPAAGTKPLHM